MNQSLLTEITAALAAITPEEMQRVKNCLEPVRPDEEALASVEDEEAWRLWTLAYAYDRQAGLTRHAARFDAQNKAEEKQLCQEANRLGAMESIVRELAWRRMEDIAGNPLLPRGRTLGLRVNFTLVSAAEPEQEVQSIPLPTEVKEYLQEQIRRRLGGRMEPGGEKGKPQ